MKSSVYVIAEAGINHNSDIQIAKKMIETASKCGADAIKFQTFTPDELFSELINPELYNLSKTWVLTKNDHIEFLAPNGKLSCFCKNSPQICDALTLVEIGAGWNAEG